MKKIKFLIMLWKNVDLNFAKKSVPAIASIAYNHLLFKVKNRKNWKIWITEDISIAMIICGLCGCIA